MPMGKRKAENSATYRVAATHLQLVEGPQEGMRDPIAVIMAELENALQHKRQYRTCLARLLKKSSSD